HRRRKGCPAAPRASEARESRRRACARRAPHRRAPRPLAEPDWSRDLAPSMAPHRASRRRHVAAGTNYVSIADLFARPAAESPLSLGPPLVLLWALSRAP